MFTFLIRLALKAAIVQKFRFVSLTLALVIASLLLVVLSALYLNGESHMAVELSGVPNMVIEPQSSFLDSATLSSNAIKKIKSPRYFWHNNLANIIPITTCKASINGRSIKLAGTWFNKDFPVDDQHYTFGLLDFSNWKYTGTPPTRNSVILGSNVKLSGPITLVVNGEKEKFHVAGKINTGSFWDNYVFIDTDVLSGMTGKKGYDKLLVSALFKPNDKLAEKADRLGPGMLSHKEFEKWMCSAYIGVVALTMGKTLPTARIHVQRRITEVQAGIIKATSAVFIALFLLTLIASITTVYSAEKMYVSSHLKDFGIMAAIGASHKKILVQVFAEIFFASLLSAIVIYFVSRPLVNYLSKAVYGIRFDAKSILIVVAILIPFMVSSLALGFLRKSLRQNTIKLLN